MRLGNINSAHLPGIKHLIVDEYQDLNECDQDFVQRIANAGASLFVAGDDDQSIYAFRYAAPVGIQNFLTVYPSASAHQLEHCFRCSPAIVGPASALIQLNPGRLPKNIKSLWTSAQPSVDGSFHIWRFNFGVEEARAIATSCRDLINAGMPAQDILILVVNIGVQVPLLIQELQALNLPFERPKGGWMLDEPMPRLVFSLLRLLQNSQDYVAHRTILGLQHGVGPGICTKIANKTVGANLNFRDLYYVTYPTGIFSKRENLAIQQVASVIHQISSWSLADDILARDAEIQGIIGNTFNASKSQAGQDAVQQWQTLMASLPVGMNLEELLGFLRSDTEAGQSQILAAVETRLGLNIPNTTNSVASPRIRILTMHGSKGLDGMVVFIPGFEQGLMPSRYAIQAPGLVHEQRRLLYMSITRAKAACVLSIAKTRVGQQAFRLGGAGTANRAPSMFLNDIGTPPQNRSSGFSSSEVKAILADVSNM